MMVKILLKWVLQDEICRMRTLNIGSQIVPSALKNMRVFYRFSWGQIDEDYCIWAVFWGEDEES